LKRDKKFILVTMARAVVISVRSAGGGGDAAITPPLPSLSYSI